MTSGITLDWSELRVKLLEFVDKFDAAIGVACPDCDRTGAKKTIEKCTEHLGEPGSEFDFDYSFEAPVYTCECGVAWTDHEKEEASVEARRLEVERRYRLKVIEERRMQKATDESVDRMRQFCADGMGLRVDQVGGLEGSVLALAVEATTLRKAQKNTLSDFKVFETKYDDLLKEVESLRRFKAAVDEALNSGDGTYRP